MVLNESSEALGNCSEIVQILVIAGDGVSRNCCSLFIVLQIKSYGVFWCN